MQEASFSSFLRTVFYILMFYYLFKFLARLFLPMLVKKAVEKAGENFQKQQQYTQDSAWKKAQYNEEVVYKETQSKNPRETKKVGDYVDYEEID
jgi:hypothetical protein